VEGVGGSEQNEEEGAEFKGLSPGVKLLFYHDVNRKIRALRTKGHLDFQQYVSVMVNILADQYALSEMHFGH
jgi:hypothetical protein